MVLVGLKRCFGGGEGEKIVERRTRTRTVQACRRQNPTQYMLVPRSAIPRSRRRILLLLSM